MRQRRCDPHSVKYLLSGSLRKFSAPDSDCTATSSLSLLPAPPAPSSQPRLHPAAGGILFNRSQILSLPCPKARWLSLPSEQKHSPRNDPGPTCLHPLLLHTLPLHCLADTAAPAVPSTTAHSYCRAFAVAVPSALNAFPFSFHLSKACKGSVESCPIKTALRAPPHIGTDDFHLCCPILWGL